MVKNSSCVNEIIGIMKLGIRHRNINVDVKTVIMELKDVLEEVIHVTSCYRSNWIKIEVQVTAA